ncbi:MAG TPA: S8 family peptidase [Opitutaceae bacterium]|nr:S8 family peptidase [Opitutaceae bacterium]
MKRHSGAGEKLLFIVGLLGAAFASATAAPPAALPPAAAQPEPAAFRPDRILVRPKNSAASTALQQLHATSGNQVLKAFPALGGLQIVKIPSVANVNATLARLRQSGLVDYAEPDYLMQIQATPNDFHYWNGDQWNLNNTGIYGGTPGADVHAPGAWDAQTDASGIVVAVVDTGVRYTHEDLAANMWTNPGETGLDALGRDKRTNGVDDDGDGYIDDVHGINVLTHSGDPNDDFGHGTHVAGIIGAVGDNSVGIAGIAWHVQLMACKFIDSSGNGSISDAVTCLDYARAKGAKVVNASWGSCKFTSQALYDAISNLADAGILFVAAAGNANEDNDVTPLYPASYGLPNIISVAATDRQDNRAPFSNYGHTTVDLAAPGNPVFSCWNGSDSDYRNWDGTSMAAPHVTGACALLLAHFPGETYGSIIGRLIGSVDPLPAFANNTVSGGRLNIARALQSSAPTQPPQTNPDTIWCDDAIPAGAWTVASGGDAWTWVTSDPTPFSGAKAHQSAIASGYHDHTFVEASATLAVGTGDTLFAYIYVDPANPPSEIMLSWNDGSSWEHRAYWGANLVTDGTDGTASRHPMGALPAVGQWVRLEIPASAVALEGVHATGMSFSLVGGRATWDATGKRAP